MSMKCRCGSKDKLQIKNNEIINQDGRKHICLGKTEPTNFSNDAFLKKKKNEIMLQAETDTDPKPESEITKYTRKQNLILEEIEHVLIDEDPSLKTNVQKLGMKMKIIYLGLPLGTRVNTQL